MTAPILRRALAVLATAVALVVGLGGCSQDAEVVDRTATVQLGGAEQVYDVDSCGLDGETVFLVARSPGGAILQVVMGLDPDEVEAAAEDGAELDGTIASSGLTVDLQASAEDTRVAAFGPEAWARRDGSGTPPGTVSSARLRGSRVQLSGSVQAVDATDRLLPGAEPQPFRVDGRCDLDED